MGILLLIAAVSLYFYIDPQRSNMFPKCTFLQLTGLQCPGCGSQRAIHQLLHGNIMEACRYNTFVIIAIPYILLGWFVEYQSIKHGKCNRIRNILYGRSAIYISAITITLFFLIRNNII
ncbi:DUF2752 domain-containing protein [Halosquirtibacter laminarini]|uniref:DUF2752 domain-containing protein n=1 Tax=Halosquirtibacter laminarini TaxID=3374600 RepID=A0AC61NQ55_9BACT|nr:DUF2752 domain-containing protein [Prolixibacteraceae bacterium]